MNAATHCVDEIGVHDGKGSIADAKSILGLMSLDYTHPVMLVSENEKSCSAFTKPSAETCEQTKEACLYRRASFVILRPCGIQSHPTPGNPK